MIVTVYGKPKCTACDATKRLLNKLQIPHTVIDVTEDAEALAYVKSLGYFGAPVVVADTSSGLHHWSDFRESKIKVLAKDFGRVE